MNLFPFFHLFIIFKLIEPIFMIQFCCKYEILSSLDWIVRLALIGSDFSYSRLCKLLSFLEFIDFCHILDISILYLLDFILMHALLDERLSVELLSHFDTQLEMFTHKAFKLFGPLSLSLLLVSHIVVMFHYLLNRPPELLNHFGHIDSFPSHLMLHIFDVLLLL